MKRGVFISFEGSEGCGKSTQIARLESRLRDVGVAVLRTREPGGTAVGERVRDLLQHAPEGAGMCHETELLLFAASRAQLVREVIRPALEAGTWVIADRFLDSTTVYQGIGRGLDTAAVAAINGFAVGDCLPDATFLLDMDAAVGHARAVASRGEVSDRMEDQPIAFFEAVREGYLALAREHPRRIHVVDASDGIERIEQRIWLQCRKQFDEFFR
ncbi:MAG: dTMP kinase [Verrucomicrobiae bacterium]|nr:dTMP kinase [Verrucomicrobiae bacterium]MCB1093109.1 dTMP kinase [Verrucomicrobiae bacterium]